MSLDQRNRGYQKRYERAFRWGLAASVILHVLAFLFFAGQRLPPSPFAAAGERRGDARAARGGGMEAVELRPPTVETRTPPPVPVVVEEVVAEETPDPEPEIEELPTIALALGAATPGDPGPEIGPGLTMGEGLGDGGTEAEGLFRVVPPRPKGVILPPGDRPDRVRGQEVEVWVYVSAAGEVVSDSTQIRPPTGDRGFDRRLREQASEWVFEAARRDGKPVAEWFRYTLIM